MKTNSDEALALIAHMTRPPESTSPAMVKLLENLGDIIKDIDAENFKLRQEVQMLRAVLEQERDKVC